MDFAFANEHENDGEQAKKSSMHTRIVVVLRRDSRSVINYCFLIFVCSHTKRANRLLQLLQRIAYIRVSLLLVDPNLATWLIVAVVRCSSDKEQFDALIIHTFLNYGDNLPDTL